VIELRGLKSTHFPRLRELSIHDDARDHDDEDLTNESSVIGFLASFVSGFNSTLTRLKIFPTWKLFPSFFDKLRHFPQLTKLELSISTIDLSFTRFMVRHVSPNGQVQVIPAQQIQTYPVVPIVETPLGQVQQQGIMTKPIAGCLSNR